MLGSRLDWPQGVINSNRSVVSFTDCFLVLSNCCSNIVSGLKKKRHLSHQTGRQLKWSYITTYAYVPNILQDLFCLGANRSEIFRIRCSKTVDSGELEK